MMNNFEESLHRNLEEWRASGLCDERTALVFKELVSYLGRRQCTGLQGKLIEELFRNPRKMLKPILSELKMAATFLRMGRQVKLLSGARPDLEVNGPDGRCYVEVTLKSRDSGYSLVYGPELQEALCKHALRITPHFPASLARPIPTGGGRQERESRMRRLLDWIIKELESVSPGALPCILVEPPLSSASPPLTREQKRRAEDRASLLLYWWKDRLPSVLAGSLRQTLEVNVDGLVLLLEAIPSTPGFVAGGLTDAFWIPSEETKMKLLESISFKSQKHEAFRKQPDDCYVIGVDVEESWIRASDMLSLAYGPLIYLSSEQRSCREVYPAQECKLRSARRAGWGKLLDEVGFELAQQRPRGEQPLFMEDELGDVDGVFVLYSSQFQLIPNPFTGKERSFRLRDWFPFPQALWGIPKQDLPGV